MRKKLKLIMLVLRINMCIIFIKSGQKRAESYFRKGGNFPSKKSVKMYNRLNRFCNKVTYLVYKYKKLTSMGAIPMEQKTREAVTK